MSNNGNQWHYLASTIQPWNQSKVYETQFGAIKRIENTRSPNFNKWVSEIPYEEHQMFSTKKDAMAYVVAMVALR
jgi:hypothetical protein